MDPDVTLHLIRETILQMWVDRDPTTKAAHAEEIVDHFEALDAWLSKGGFLPTDWKKD
jgi:putative heme degradation protein